MSTAAKRASLRLLLTLGVRTVRRGISMRGAGVGQGWTLTQDQMQTMKDLNDQGYSARRIGEALGIHEATVRKRLARMRKLNES